MAASASRGWTCASSPIVIAVAVASSRTIIVPGPRGRRGWWHTPFSLPPLPIFLATPQPVLLPLLCLPLLLLSSPLLPFLLSLLLPLPLSLNPLDHPLLFIFFLLFAVESLALDVTRSSRPESSSHAVQFYLLCSGQAVRVMSFERFCIGGKRLEVCKEFLSERIDLLLNFIFLDSEENKVHQMKDTTEQTERYSPFVLQL